MFCVDMRVHLALSAVRVLETGEAEVDWMIIQGLLNTFM